MLVKPGSCVSSLRIHLFERSRVRRSFVDDVIRHLDDVFQKELLHVEGATWNRADVQTGLNQFELVERWNRSNLALAPQAHRRNTEKTTQS